MSRRARTSVNALLLTRLLGVAEGAVVVLRRDNKMGQADSLEGFLVAVEESMRQEDSSSIARELVVEKALCDRLNTQANLLSDRLAEVAKAIGADPAQELPPQVRALVEERDALKGERDASSGLADGVTDELSRVREDLEAQIESLTKGYEGKTPVPTEDWFRIANLVPDDEYSKPMTGASIVADWLGREVAKVSTLAHERDEERAAGKRQFDIIQGLRKEVARLNEQLDAAMQRAVMPTFEPEPDLAFLETPFPEAAPIASEPGTKIYPRAVREIDENGVEGFFSSPAEGPPYVVPPVGAPEPENLAPIPEEPQGEPADPAVGTGAFVGGFDPQIPPTPRPGRKPKAATPDAEPAPAVLATTGGWNLHASPEQAAAIARMIVAGSAPENIAKEIDAKPGDVAAVRDLVSADLLRVRRMLPMQREQWLQNKVKAWRKSFEGKEAQVA